MSSTTTAKKELYQSGFPKQMSRSKFDLPISRKLKAARKKRGYSLAKVVELLNDQGYKTGVSTIHGYEQDEDNMNHRYPSLHILMMLIDLYNCSADYIFDFSDEFERSSHDLYDELEKIDKVNWKGEPITSGQRGLIKEKLNEIMNL